MFLISFPFGASGKLKFMIASFYGYFLYTFTVIISGLLVPILSHTVYVITYMCGDISCLLIIAMKMHVFSTFEAVCTTPSFYCIFLSFSTGEYSKLI